MHILCVLFIILNVKIQVNDPCASVKRILKSNVYKQKLLKFRAKIEKMTKKTPL